jgi:hypothetical protein
LKRNRLDENGIDAIPWQGADQGNPHLKTLTIIFKELISDARKGVHRFTVEQELVANEDQNRYSTVVIDEQLKKRGIENVWVTTTKRPVRSAVHVKFAGLPEPITIIKRY